MANKLDTELYKRVTDSIIEQLENGVRPWFQPWSTAHAAGHVSRPLRFNGEPYRGINVLLLWTSADQNGFVSPFWLTFKQAQSLGGHVLKGEKGSRVVYASTINKAETNHKGEEVERKIAFLKQYTVFAADQCEGLPARFYEMKPTHTGIEPLVAATSFFKATNAEIREGGSQAYYDKGSDHIQMPKFECFASAEAHAATLAHETCHWTGHSERLNRNFGSKKWGDSAHAMEELVAELGSAFLCADLAITPRIMSNHASYIDSWVKVLKSDSRAIFAAASHAGQAVDFLHKSVERRIDQDYARGRDRDVEMMR